MDPGKEEQEKEEKENFPHGLLSQLWALERRSRRGSVALERCQRRREQRELRNARIRELRLRRERLRERVTQALQGKLGVLGPREVLEWKIRNCRELLRLFQLTGLSAQVSQAGTVLFSLQPAFEGSYLGPARLELAQGRLRRHCLPPFLPLEPLARRLLPRQPRAFLGELFLHLRAFASRRRQLDALQEEFPDFIQDVPSCNSLCNLLSFTYRIPQNIPKNPPGIPENPRKIPKNPENPGKIPENPGENPGKNPENPPKIQKNPEKIPKNPEKIPKNPEKNPENPPKIPQNPENPGKIPGIPKVPVEFRARLLYGDPLKSLPTHVQVTTQGGAAAPREHLELLQSLPLPRALPALAAKTG